MVDKTDVQDEFNQQERVNTDSYRKTSTVVKEFRDDPPFDPSNYESDELFKALSEIGKYSTECKGEIYKIAYKHFTQDLDSNEIDISDAVYLKQLKNYIEETQPEWAGSLGGFCDQFFESIEESSFISGDTQKAIDDRISPNTARNYLEKRGKKLSEAVESAYGSAKESPNVELIEEAQKAYLWNIWNCIDNSKIEEKPKLVSRDTYIERACQSCGKKSGLVEKYDIFLCHECLREMARDMGFKKYR